MGMLPLERMVDSEFFCTLADRGNCAKLTKVFYKVVLDILTTSVQN